MVIQYPIRFTNVLGRTNFLGIRDMFLHERWLMVNGTSDSKLNRNAGYDLSYCRKSWLIPREVLNSNLHCLDSAVVVQYKIKQKIRTDLELIRIHCNGQTRSQLADFHGDFTYDGGNSGPSPTDRLTFILFTEPSWNSEWGGEFIAQNPDTKEYHYTPYIPNSGVVVPSHWQHRGASPNAQTDKLRTTMAFSYRILDSSMD